MVLILDSTVRIVILIILGPSFPILLLFTACQMTEDPFILLQATVIFSSAAAAAAGHQPLEKV